jgi:hypothetical protein
VSLTTLNDFCGVNDKTSFSVSAVSMKPLKPILATFGSDYLGDYDAICKTVLAF